MQHDKVLWIGVGLLFLVVLSLAWGMVLTFQLGRSIQDVLPWTVVEFISVYGVDGRAGLYLQESFVWALILTVLLALPVFFLRRPTWYGDARWATGGEIRRAKLHAAAGLIVGKKHGKLFINDEPAHALVAAPTRSGKGVGIVIPNLLKWPGSVIVLDIKHENYQRTAGHRAQSQPVHLWSPMAEHSACYNPLDFISADRARRITDLQKLATLIVRDDGEGGSMWTNEARSLFIGLTLLVLDDPDTHAPRTIGQVYRLLMHEKDLVQIAEEALDADELDEAGRQQLANFKNKAEKERSGVKSQLTQALNLWANPQIDAATAHSDFDLGSLRKQPASIYVGVAQDELLTLAPLLNLFFQQAVEALSHQPAGKDEPHQVLMLIDEFPMLGRMNTLTKGLALLAGYNIRIVLICQGLGQLQEIYHQGTEGVLQNCALQIFFASNDDSTTNWVSRRLGQRTVKVQSRNQGQDLAAATTSTSYVGRPLMAPEEVRLLRETKAIIFKEKQRPVLADKIRYYTDKRFTTLLCDPPPVEEKPAAVMASDKARALEKDQGQPFDTGEVTTVLGEFEAEADAAQSQG